MAIKRDYAREGKVEKANLRYITGVSYAEIGDLPCVIISLEDLEGVTTNYAVPPQDAGQLRESIDELAAMVPGIFDMKKP